MKKWGCIIVFLGMFLWISSSQAELVQIGPEGWLANLRGGVGWLAKAYAVSLYP